MDLNMPGISGIEATRALLRELPDARVVMLTISAEDDSVSEAMLAGACGYVVKSASVSELMEAIRAARAGETFLSPPVASKLLAKWRALETASRSATAPGAALSDREIEVLRLIAAGSENTDIADALTISPNTVKRHVAAILTKLRSGNRTQAAVQAVRDGLDLRNPRLDDGPSGSRSDDERPAGQLRPLAHAHKAEAVTVRSLAVHAEAATVVCHLEYQRLTVGEGHHHRPGAAVAQCVRHRLTRDPQDGLTGLPRRVQIPRHLHRISTPARSASAVATRFTVAPSGSSDSARTSTAWRASASA